MKTGHEIIGHEKIMPEGHLGKFAGSHGKKKIIPGSKSIIICDLENHALS
jgi:hypothetical protein